LRCCGFRSLVSSAIFMEAQVGHMTSRHTPHTSAWRAQIFASQSAQRRCSDKDIRQHLRRERLQPLRRTSAESNTHNKRRSSRTAKHRDENCGAAGKQDSPELRALDQVGIMSTSAPGALSCTLTPYLVRCTVSHTNLRTGQFRKR